VTRQARPARKQQVLAADRSAGSGKISGSVQIDTAEFAYLPAAETQPSSDDRALLIAWVAAGMPAGACEPLTPPPR